MAFSEVSAHGYTWKQHERGGFWESEAGYVEQAVGRWWAFPNISPEARLNCRGPYSTRDDALRVTSEWFRLGYWQDGPA